MAELTDKHDISSFSLRKIPVSNNDKDININLENNSYLDKIKILELSSLIDNWEQELLFSDNGFFSLKGKEVENKAKEYISQLEKFINKKISEISFSSENAKKAAQEIKRIKIENIRQQLFSHQEKEIHEWEIQVYNNSIEASLKRAVSYKNDFKIIKEEFSKCIGIINQVAQVQQWTTKILKSKKDNFISNFYFSIINAYLKENDIKFVHLFEEYKKYLNEEHKEKLEQAVKELKSNIVAYNWAVEIFSYNIDNNEVEKEIKGIKDPELEKNVRKYLSLLKNQQKYQEKSLKKTTIENSWETIINLISENPAKALLSVDYNQSLNEKKAQQEYIKQITNNGFIKTDKKTYIELLKELLKDFVEFREKSLFEYKHLLSEKDFNFFDKIHKDSDEHCALIISDYKYILEKLENKGIKDFKEQYDFISVYQSVLSDYELINSKTADIEKKNKIIDAIFDRHNKGVK